MQRPLTPLDFKRRAVQLFGRKIGVVDGDKRFSYADFGQRCDRLANALRDLGVARFDRVAVMAFNSHPLLEAYFGVLDAGAVLLPLNIRLSAQELATIINHAEPSVMLVDHELAPVLSELWPALASQPKLVWIGERPEGRAPAEPIYDELLAAASAEPPPRVGIDENDVAELFYTSGTTGTPRGVMLTHRNLYLHALGMMVTFRAAEPDVQLHSIPLFHVNGWGTPQGITAVGGRHVMLRKFDAAEVLRIIETEKVTRFFAVPTMLNMLLNHPDVKRRDLSSLELINTGGAPTPPEMVRQAEQLLGCCVAGGYGLTETSPIVTFAADKTYLADQDEATRLRRRASTGLPVVGAEIAIVDIDGNPLDWDGETVGEIVVRSNAVTTGYYKDPEATEKATSDGWFHTGDLATIDEEGYVLIVDRKKDLIISGGENISSVEIEKVLFEHPAVLECAIVSAPDERWGEVPVAVVALAQGAHASAKELQDFCRERLAGFKVPKQVDFMDSLPKGGTGKIIKRQLREPYWKGRTERVH